MIVKGFIAHAQENRQKALLYVAIYCLTFMPIALLGLAIFPVIIGQASTLLFNPALYVVTALPLAICIILLLLAKGFFGIQRDIKDHLKIKRADTARERRFVQIGEEQAIAQGLRNPVFGIIETPARNAVSIGGLPGQNMIAVTRGLLTDLDDDEVAAVIAHEMAHFRLGDTNMLTLNHALKFTALWLQTSNPIKPDIHVHTKYQGHFVLGIFFPVFLLALAIGGFMTWIAWKATKRADALVRSSRDFVADTEAVRVTHFPESLESAIAKCEGRGYFEGAEKFEALLFSGSPSSAGGTHPSLDERKKSLRSVAGMTYFEGRKRRDTRRVQAAAFAPQLSSAGFGRRGMERAATREQAASFAKANARKKELPREPGSWQLYAAVFDRKMYRQWQRDMFDQLAWREDDDRNFLGATPEATLWLVGCFILSILFYTAISDTTEETLHRMSGVTLLQETDKVFQQMWCNPMDRECEHGGTFRYESAKTPN